jgi:2-methylisocitrate lyase-like PEP mutase family enzyme
MPQSISTKLEKQRKGCDLLRDRFARRDTLLMPDAFNALSARLIEHMGFLAVLCSGYCFSLSAACPSEAEFGMEGNLALTTQICQAVAIPVMADGEDGFGGPDSVEATVRAYISAGVVGINIEDQVLDVLHPKAVINVDLACEKIAAAVAAARDSGLPQLIVNARTDALAVATDKQAGLAEAIKRANHYLDRGAALTFITGVTSMEQVDQLIGNIDGPVSIAAGMQSNITSFSVAALRSAGVARVSLPSIPLFAAIEGMRNALGKVSSSNSFNELIERRSLADPELLTALSRPRIG